MFSLSVLIQESAQAIHCEITNCLISSIPSPPLTTRSLLDSTSLLRQVSTSSINLLLSMCCTIRDNHFERVCLLTSKQFSAVSGTLSFLIKMHLSSCAIAYRLGDDGAGRSDEKVIGFRALSSVQLQNVARLLMTWAEWFSITSSQVGKCPRRLKQVGKNISSLACT